MKKIKKILKDWSFLILLVVFGCVYTAVFGLPLSDGGKQLQLSSVFPFFAEKDDDGKEQADGSQPPGETEDTQAVGAESETGIEEDTGEDAGSEEPAAEAPEGAQGASAEQETDAGNLADDPGSEEGNDIGEPGRTEPEEIVYRTVEDEYFDNAVFIGDSRTMGMYEYGELEERSAFCCSNGMTVYKMFNTPIVKAPAESRDLTVEELLSEKQFSAIYLMIGINEMGVGTVETFIERYISCVEHLRELQPDAVIYLQSIIRVTVERSAKGDYISNEGIDARNAEIEKIADNKNIFYLDINPVVCDGSGGMIEEYTFDGVHLKAKYIALWKDYLKSHVVDAVQQEGIVQVSFSFRKLYLSQCFI